MAIITMKSNTEDGEHTFESIFHFYEHVKWPKKEMLYTPAEFVYWDLVSFKDSTYEKSEQIIRNTLDEDPNYVIRQKLSSDKKYMMFIINFENESIRDSHLDLIRQYSSLIHNFTSPDENYKNDQTYKDFTIEDDSVTTPYDSERWIYLDQLSPPTLMHTIAWEYEQKSIESLDYENVDYEVKTEPYSP